MIEKENNHYIWEICMETNLEYKSTLLFIENHIRLTQEILKRYLTSKEVFELLEDSIKFLLYYSEEESNQNDETIILDVLEQN